MKEVPIDDAAKGKKRSKNYAVSFFIKLAVTAAVIWALLTNQPDKYQRQR